MMTALASILLALGGDDSEVRATIERSLPYLQKEGVAWIGQRNCISCHHVPFLLWSFREAQSRGIWPDSSSLAGWTDWARQESMKQREKVKLSSPGLEALQGEGMPAETLAKLATFPEKFGGNKEEVFLKELEKFLAADELSLHKGLLLKHATRDKGDGGGLDSMVQLLLADAYGSGGATPANFVASTRARIVEMQQADGSWKPGGQLFSTNRSAAEATQLTTMWAALALSEALDVASKGSVGRARTYLKDAQAGKILEWLAVRLLLARKLEETDVAESVARELLARQNPDGGWASLHGAATDAFATGQALYALAGSGERGAADAIARGRKLLIGTQAADGSWTVPPAAVTSPTKKGERLKSLEPIYRYWGSAWAAIGLASTLPGKS